jgi:ATP-dependent protease HslVU (ClpYQ) peptidase subunit
VTVIIAHRSGWMCADRRQTFNGHLIGPYRTQKIRRGQGILVACAGNGVFKDLVQEALDAAPASGQLRAMVELFREKGNTLDAHALAVTADGIVEITSDGAQCWVTADWWAIGSGYMAALGYLEGASHARPLTPEMAAEAIAFAATLTNDVGDGIQTEHL